MKKILLNIFCVLIGVSFILIALEIFLRISPKFGYIYHSFKESNDPMIAKFKENNLQPSELLGYENIPNCGRINSYGLVGKEYNLQKDKNTFRILLLGDSIAWQDHSRQFLENFLNDNSLLNTKYKFEIWNAGCPSYDCRRYAVFLEHRGLLYKPDMVMIFVFMNDFGMGTNFYYKDKDGVVVYHMPLNEVSKRFVVNSFLIRHSYLYRFLILKVDSYLMNKKKIQRADSNEETGRFYINKIKDLCEESNLPLFLVIFPYLKPLSEYKDYQISEYQSINKVIKSTGIKYINLYALLPEQELYNLRNNKEDEIHPSRDGHILIGKIIYNYLLDKCFHNY